MLDTMYDNEINDSKMIWSRFVESIKNDVNSLNTRGNEITESEKKYRLFSEILSDNNKIIDNKALFIELDPSLEPEFSKLIFFKEKNNMDNKMAELALKRIVTNNKVVEATTPSITSKTELESINSKIQSLEVVLNGNFTPSDIVEAAKLHNMTDDEIKQILFYYIYRTTPMVRVEMQRRENRKIKNEIKRQDKVVEKDTSEEVTIAEIPYFNVDTEPTIKDKYEEEKKKYDEVRATNKAIMSNYSAILKNNKSVSSYANVSKEQLYELGLNEDDIAEVIAYKLFKAKESTENYINLIDMDFAQNNDLLENDCEMAIKKMHEFEELMTELIKLDKKELEGEVENANFSNSELFFAHDEEGAFLIQNEEEYINKAYDILRGTDDATIENSYAKAYRVPYVEREEKLLGKEIYMLISSPSVSYVKVNYNNAEAKYIITVNQKSKIGLKTSQLLIKYGDIVVNQIAAIENNDEEELKRQAKLKESLCNNEEGL